MSILCQKFAYAISFPLCTFFFEKKVRKKVIWGRHPSRRGLLGLLAQTSKSLKNSLEKFKTEHSCLVGFAKAKAEVQRES